MPGQFIPVTSDPDGEGYFEEDRESVYCMHGNYVGYPGGADYMCPYCEDGANTLYKADCYYIQGIVEDTGEVLYLSTLYSEEAVTSALEVLQPIIEGPGSTGKVHLEVITDDFYYWGK